MKLLVVTPYFYPKIGGMENYAYNIAKGLKNKYGWKIIVVTSNHEKKQYKVEFIDGIKIYRLPTLLKVSNTPINPRWFFLMKKIIKKEKPDIINGHTPVPFIADIAALLAKLENIPFVLTYQNDLVKENKLINYIIRSYYQLLGNKTGVLSSSIIASSNYYVNRSFFLKKFKNKIEIIPPGVNMSFIKSIKIDPETKYSYKDKKIILFVGQLDKTHVHKGLNNLIQSMNLVKTKIKNAKLVIIGKGDMVDEYKALVRRLELEDNVQIYENINDQELIQYYKQSNVVVLPSTSELEGFGMVLIEAGACKKPVIGSNIGGIPNVIDNDKTGLLIPPKDTKALCKSIIKLLNDDEVAKKMGENGYRKVIDNFTWDKQIDKTNKLFRNII